MSGNCRTFIENYCTQGVEEDKAFKWNNIILFFWKEWDQLDTDELIFYNCTSPDGRLHKVLTEYYQGHPEIPVDQRGMDISVRLDGWIQINAWAKQTVTGHYNDREVIDLETYTLYEGWILDWDYARMKMMEYFETYKECKI